MWKIKVDKGVKCLSSLGDQWERLFINGAHEPSVSLEWTHALCANHLNKNDKLYVVTITRGNKIQCLVPLVAKMNTLGSLSFVELFPIAELYNTHSDLLTDGHKTEIYEIFIKALFDLDLRWDIFRMGRLLEEHPFLTFMEKYSPGNSLLHRIRFEQPSFFLPLPSTFHEYLSARSSKFRNHLKRKQKKLNIQHIRHSRLRDISEVDKYYTDLLTVESNSWKHPHGTAISSVNRQSIFYRKLCYGAMQRNRLHLLLTYDNDTPIAYDLGYVQNKSYHYIKTSYDANYRKLSPATVSRAFLIESLIDENIRYFDFPGEPYAWEQQWTDQLRWHKSIVIFNNNIKSRALSFLMFLKKNIKREKNNKALRFCDPKALRSHSSSNRPGDE